MDQAPTFDQRDIDLDISTESPGELSVVATGVCDATTTSVRLKGAGACTIRVDQAASPGFLAASADATINVGKGIRLFDQGGPIPWSRLPRDVQIQPSWALHPTYSTNVAERPGDCWVEGRTVRINKTYGAPGTCTFAAKAAESANWRAVETTIAIELLTATFRFEFAEPPATLLTAVVGEAVTTQVKFRVLENGTPSRIELQPAGCVTTARLPPRSGEGDAEGSVVTFELSVPKDSDACTVRPAVASNGAYGFATEGPSTFTIKVSRTDGP